MSGRELVVLGTASQVPTRTRNHNGYLLRWDAEGVLFDPGEGTQRQLLLADVSPSGITAICITHAHGDHCLGLPGVLQRLSLDGVTRPLPLVFPAAAAGYVDRLRHASVFLDRLDVRAYPVSEDGVVLRLGELTLEARALKHRIPTFGYRLVEPDGRRMRPDLLAARGVSGPDVGRLLREGVLDRPDGPVRLEDVSEPRPGQRFAFVMDTAVCSGAADLAAAADLLVCESTFSADDAELATAYAHLTSRQAAEIAASAGARRLVLTHFSQRYENLEPLLAQARAVFTDVVLAQDLMRVPVPRRRR
ncbi:MAG: ribonuclease Z [Actinomycetes bacterium]